MTNPYSKIKSYRLMLMNSEGKCVWGASVSQSVVGVLRV